MTAYIHVHGFTAWADCAFLLLTAFLIGRGTA